MKEAQYHPIESLTPRSVVEGARMWSVSLEKTMFTCFEVDPHSRFAKHSHVSEQITMVLKGELFFEVSNGIICVKEGEVIAVPSSVPHAAFTKDTPVIAVDAWSPVMDKYRQKEKCKLEIESVIVGGMGMKP